MKLQALSVAAPIKAVMPAQQKFSVIAAQKDEVVIEELKKELSKTMEEKQVNNWIETVISICKNLTIEPSKLPVNEKYPGSLTKEETSNFLKSFYDRLFS